MGRVRSDTQPALVKHFVELPHTDRRDVAMFVIVVVVKPMEDVLPDKKRFGKGGIDIGSRHD